MGRIEALFKVYASFLQQPESCACRGRIHNESVQRLTVSASTADFSQTRAENLSFSSKNIAQVEDSLLPVGVLGVGAGGEVDGLVASAELNVEPGDESVDEVGALGAESVGNLEGKVGGGDGVEVEGDDRARVGDESLHLNGVHEGLVESNLLHRAIVKSVDVVPD